MRTPVIPMDGNVVGFMDIGTNSVRLLVIRIYPDKSYTVLTDQREIVRLGEGEFPQRRLQPEMVEKTVLVCTQFSDLARAFDAERIVAVATSASREAENRNVLLDRLRDESQIDVRVISGREEARLIYLGVSSGMNLGGEFALFIDIGGGSTELAVGGQSGYVHLDSLQLGAMRVTARFFQLHETRPVSRDCYKKIKRYVTLKTARSVQNIREYNFTSIIGSSGTITNLAEAARRMFPKKDKSGEDLLTYPKLRKLTQRLCALSLEERKKVSGLNPIRADIIIAGAAILETLMEQLDLGALRVSERSLRDGLVMDHISRGESNGIPRTASLRKRSVLQLARSFPFDTQHARQVRRLALQLFDSAKEAQLHSLDEWERELLEYAALLHDIGTYLSFHNHHLHGAYLIRNAELLGFDQKETALLSATVLFHQKGLPKAKHAECEGLDKDSIKTVAILSVFLRLAESLNRRRLDVVRSAALKCGENDNAILEITSDRDCQLEIWSLTDHLKPFTKTFGRGFEVIKRFEEPVFSLESDPEP